MREFVEYIAIGVFAGVALIMLITVMEILT